MHPRGGCSLARSALLVLAACGSTPSSSPPAPPVPANGSSVGAPETWPIPAGWKHETIPFPLGFAPGIAHRGVEELRFAPGMFDPAAAGYWSYVFVWRTEDAATLAAPILAAELTAYFRGLLAAVDEKDKRIANLDDIVVTATGSGEGETKLTLAVHVIDAFKTGQPVDLTGWAQRTACGSGALWVFVMAPDRSGVREELDRLAGQAACGQKLPVDKSPASAER